MDHKKELKNLVEEQFKIYEKLKDFKKNCKDNPVKNTTPRLKLLSSYFTEFSDRHNKIKKNCIDHKIDKGNEKYFQEDLLVSFELLYRETEKELSDGTSTPSAAKKRRQSAAPNKMKHSKEDDAQETSTRKPSLRVPSPVSSESESIVAASNSSHVEPAASSTPGPSNQFVEVETPAFKKIKLTREVPYTEGYLEESTPFVPKSSQLRKSSPPPAKQRANPPQKPRPPPNPREHQEEGQQQQQQHICSTCPCIAAQENEYDKIGKAWASELKLMTLDQQIFAKRAIAEIIFEGQLGGLSRNSVLQRRGGDGDPFVEEAEYIFEKTEPTSVI